MLNEIKTLVLAYPENSLVFTKPPPFKNIMQ